MENASLDWITNNNTLSTINTFIILSNYYLSTATTTTITITITTSTSMIIDNSDNDDNDDIDSDDSDNSDDSDAIYGVSTMTITLLHLNQCQINDNQMNYAKDTTATTTTTTTNIAVIGTARVSKE